MSYWVWLSKVEEQKDIFSPLKDFRGDHGGE